MPDDERVMTPASSGRPPGSPEGTILPAGATGSTRRTRRIVVATGSAAAVVVALAGSYLALRHSGSSVNDVAQRGAVVSEAQFEATANAKCVSDYNTVRAAANSHANDRGARIDLAAALSERLSADVSSLPHPVADDPALARIRATSHALVMFLRENKAALASDHSPERVIAQTVTTVEDSGHAYLALGLNKCTSPKAP
jgi:hypothetical protein